MPKCLDSSVIKTSSPDIRFTSMKEICLRVNVCMTRKEEKQIRENKRARKKCNAKIFNDFTEILWQTIDVYIDHAEVRFVFHPPNALIPFNT